MGAFVGGKQAVPIGFILLAAGDGAPIGVDILRNLKRWQVPTNRSAGERNLLCAQRLAVGFGGVGAVGAAFADAGFAHDERGLVC